MEQSPPISDVPPPGQPAMSLASRLFNVFATPGDVFDEVKAAPSATANWLMPVFIACVIGSLATIIIFSQPAILQNIREQQGRQWDKLVQTGKMTREQADQAISVSEKIFGSTMMKIFGVVMAVVGSFVRVFWWATVLWLFGKWFFKVRFGYMKAVEVAGLASMIAVMQIIVGLLITVILGKVIGPSLALFVEDSDMADKKHLLLGAANVFYFWQAGLMSLGLARLAGVPCERAVRFVFTFWLIWELLLILMGLGWMAL